MNRPIIIPVIVFIFISCNPRLADGLYKKDLSKDIAMLTDKGTIVIRLSDSTPLHRNNFIKLVKEKYYDSILFHRVIKEFMIQAGDPDSKRAKAGQQLGRGGPGYMIPAEFRPGLFHKKGVIAAAGNGNPEKASSGSQFYLVQGKKFTDAGLDSVETFQLNGRKIPLNHRAIYKTVGGAPHLDQGYTVFGEVVKGQDVVDSIANTPTSGRSGGNRPILDIHIKQVKLVKRRQG
jgi:cyclophilin family peptidyl-prolyl cis-trans isomerase